MKPDDFNTHEVLNESESVLRDPHRGTVCLSQEELYAVTAVFAILAGWRRNTLEKDHPDNAQMGIFRTQDGSAA
jgi:hypothetical protein